MATSRSDIEWAESVLGPQRERIRHEVVLAITEAHVEAAAAQYTQGSSANDTYGHTLKVRQHELLNARLREIPGIALRRPAGVRSRFKFPIIDETNAVLVPLRFSNDPHVSHDQVSRINLSDLRRALLAGPTPPEEPTLIEMATVEDYEERYEDELAAYEQLVSAGRAVVIGYGSTPDGIFELGLGELVVEDDERGAVSWRRWIPLPLYADLAAVPSAPQLRVVRQADDVERFDEGAELDSFGLRLRPSVEVAPDPEARPDDKPEQVEGPAS
jgi:hypothetical protein